jgi:anti-anti-sigma regulatory factor
MEITLSHDPSKPAVAVLVLKGDLTAEAPLVGQAQTAFQDGARNIVLDLSKVNYISSAGLRAIHTIYTMLRSADPADEEAAVRGIARGTYKSPHLNLVRPSKSVSKVLSMAGYDMFLEIHDNQKAALATFG